ncbi:hypothetical protein V2J09_012628 [Rumex salicifolius]
MYLLVYVDDIIVTSSSPTAVTELISTLSTQFSLKDLGELSYLGGGGGLKSGQKLMEFSYLNPAGMSNTKVATTPLSASLPLLRGDREPLPSPTEYRTLVGSLQYLNLTRLDLAYSINKLAQFMQAPTSSHWTALKRLLRYLDGTRDRGIPISASSPLSFHAYFDADWADDKDDYISTSGYLLYLGGTPIYWSSRKQKSVARSSTEAEYNALEDTATEVSWVISLFGELGHILHDQPEIYCDNLGATSLSANPVFHSRMKHIALAYHFVHEQVQAGTL